MVTYWDVEIDNDNGSIVSSELKLALVLQLLNIRTYPVLCESEKRAVIGIHSIIAQSNVVGSNLGLSTRYNTNVVQIQTARSKVSRSLVVNSKHSRRTCIDQGSRQKAAVSTAGWETITATRGFIQIFHTVINYI